MCLCIFSFELIFETTYPSAHGGLSWLEGTLASGWTPAWAALGWLPCLSAYSKDPSKKKWDTSHSPDFKLDQIQWKPVWLFSH